jgi:hypothetical protein
MLYYLSYAAHYLSYAAQYLSHATHVLIHAAHLLIYAAPSELRCILIYLLTVLRVSRSYSLKVKISENVGIFVLALKRKKVVNFALFA